MKWDPNKEGDIAELQAATWLMKQGYDVFRNQSCVGPVDMIAMCPETGEVILVEVKKATIGPERRARGVMKPRPARYLTKKQKGMGVRLLCIYDGEVYWHEAAKDEH